ncbi:ubiquitin conjugation factor E4 [Trichodelitschia bisporula]|uniref:Ubiquitin conjugation factor E4 n=1 Tax=Trichodelitschia bisporula TaxID=703511 RepID=A0A6G1HTA8_9PEZI|nr:ubiquitin conjugation factor E4 [Trichodelitschia bisporula]
MADAQSDADKIRNKRLAKLGGGGSSSGSSNPGESSGATPPLQASEAPIEAPREEPSVPQQTAPPTLAPAPAPRADGRAPPRITITKRPAEQAETAVRPRSRQRETFEEWEDRVLCTIFRITLHPEHVKDAHGERVHFVSGVVADLNEQEAPMNMTIPMLDNAILEAVAASPQQKPLVYLLGCWKRVMKQLRALRGANADDPKLDVLKEAKKICMSYCIFAVTMPEIYGLPPAEDNALAEHLLADPECDGGICHDFIMEAVSRFPEEEEVRDAFVGAVEQLSRELAQMTMNMNFKPYVQALRSLVRYPAITDAITQSPLFLPEAESIEPQNIELDTLLGPWFRLSPLQGDVALNYFMGARTRDDAYIRNSQDALRMTLRTHQDELFDIANSIIKSSKNPRERLLDWFALAINKNHKRRALRINEKEVASDSFMINITAILDRLCEPFMDATFSKVDRIDIDYFRRSPRVDIHDETKINADQKMSDEFYSHQASGANNFISEVFFLTVAAHHYGAEAANSKLSQIQRDLKALEEHVADFEKKREQFAHNPQQLALFEAALKKHKDRIEKTHCIVSAVQGVLLDDLAQQRSLQLVRYICVWILRLVSPQSAFPKKPVTLPLPEEQPETYRCLPEYLIYDIVDNFKFVTRNMPHIILPAQCDELVTVCITFLRSSEYIKNPGLKASLVTILFYGTLPVRGRPKGILGDVLNASPFALKHLLHALMKFYIEAESTGVSSQFYDKFNIRYEIFQVIRCIWNSSIYRENLNTESKVNVNFFVHFVNLLINDVTFLLDESFSAFRNIHKLQDELEGPHAASLDETEKKDKEDALQENERKAKSYMQLTNETVSMLRVFTEALAPAFAMSEVVQRLADMLDHNLDSMVSEKQQNLKVRDAAGYGFDPRKLLSDMVSVYINLKDQPNFQLAVARDGRSYKPQNFANAVRILRIRPDLKTPEELATFLKFADTVQATKEADDQEEELLGEIPEEYLDPLMYTLMEDPVILPNSKVTIDRSTIRSHLLSDPHDPFNRMALRIEDVVPNTELKAKISAFRTEARERRIAEIQAQKEKDGAPSSADAIGLIEGGSLVETNLPATGDSNDRMDLSEG